MIDDNLLEFLSIPKENISNTESINGILLATVTDNKDPNNLGRVKIMFESYSPNKDIEWVRVSNIVAGKNRGSFFIPEIGDEVIVAFQQGYIDRPIVIGSLYSKEDTPPEKTKNDNNCVKMLRTRSGHEIIFDDKEEKESILIKSKSGHKIILDDVKDSEKIVIEDKTGNNSIVINSSQDSLVIKSGKEIKINASEIEIQAEKTLTLKSNGEVIINGQMTKINC